MNGTCSAYTSSLVNATICYHEFMNKNDQLKQALEILKDLRNDSTEDPWEHESNGGDWTISNNVGDVVAYEVNHGYDADLIVLLRNIVDAQITVLEAAIASTDSSSLQLSVLHLAETIIEKYRQA